MEYLKSIINAAQCKIFLGMTANSVCSLPEALGFERLSKLASVMAV